jgi:hypothetical protein
MNELGSADMRHQIMSMPNTTHFISEEWGMRDMVDDY